MHSIDWHGERGATNQSTSPAPSFKNDSEETPPKYRVDGGVLDATKDTAAPFF